MKQWIAVFLMAVVVLGATNISRGAYAGFDDLIAPPIAGDGLTPHPNSALEAPGGLSSIPVVLDASLLGGPGMVGGLPASLFTGAAASGLLFPVNGAGSLGETYHIEWEYSPVPEASTCGLVAGLGCLVILVRRFRR